MSVVVPVLSRPQPVDWTLVCLLSIAGAVAWLAPFDLAFGALTLGNPALRSATIVVLALTGLKVGEGLGMSFRPQGLKHPIALPVAAAAAMAVFCSVADWLLSPDRHGSFAQMVVSTPLPTRVAHFMLRAVNENILYRLFLGPVLIWPIARVWKTADGRPAEGAYWLGFLLAQSINIWINVTARAPVTPPALLHDAVRYIVPGLGCAWLYRRHGFQSTEIACTTVHLFYQPLVALGFG
jgi:hypothetical protein